MSLQTWFRDLEQGIERLVNKNYQERRQHGQAMDSNEIEKYEKALLDAGFKPEKVGKETLIWSRPVPAYILETSRRIAPKQSTYPTESK